MSELKPTKKGWFEHYECGCISAVFPFKKDLLGYCGRHGHSRKAIYSAVKFWNRREKGKVKG